MFFRFATSVLAAVAIAQTAVAQLSPTQVVAAINVVATISSNTNSALVPLPSVPTVPQGQAFANNLVSAFRTIISDLAADVALIQATPPFDADGADDVVPVLDSFIAIHQTLLGTVIGKHSIFAQFALTAPIAAVLRDLEAGVDTFATAIIALLPTATAHVQSGTAALSQTLTISVQTYAEICIPSALYPQVPPVCVAA